MGILSHPTGEYVGCDKGPKPERQSSVCRSLSRRRVAMEVLSLVGTLRGSLRNTGSACVSSVRVSTEPPVPT